MESGRVLFRSTVGRQTAGDLLYGRLGLRGGDGGQQGHPRGGKKLPHPDMIAFLRGSPTGAAPSSSDHPSQDLRYWSACPRSRFTSTGRQLLFHVDSQNLNTQEHEAGMTSPKLMRQSSATAPKAAPWLRRAPLGVHFALDICNMPSPLFTGRP